jgi:two-component system, cell cycle sensor histidine kinase and response regulator CckA
VTLSGRESGPSAADDSANPSGSALAEPFSPALALTIAHSPDPGAVLDTERRLVAANEAFALLVGRGEMALLGCTLADILGPEVYETRLRPALEKAFAGEPGAVSLELYQSASVGTRYLSGRCVPLPGSPVPYVAVLLRDVTQEVVHERERTLVVEALKLLDLPTSTEQLARQVTELLHTYSGCESVGLRLHEGGGCLYFETHGSPPQFTVTERSLCERDGGAAATGNDGANPLLQCLCGNVLRGQIDPRQPYYTAFGSFWANSITDLLASTGEDDQAKAARNRCSGLGCESLALIPLHSGGETLGLLQFGDRRRGALTPGYVAILERLACSLAAGLARRKAEAAQRASDERLSSIMERSLDGIVVTDAAGLVVMWNQAEADITGIDAREAIGRPLWQVQYQVMVPERRAATPPERLRAALEGMFRAADSKERRSYTFEQELLRPDGSRRVVQTVVFPMAGQSGRLVCSVSRDVTEQRRAEDALRESERRYRQLFQQSVSGFAFHEIVLAPDGTPVDYRFLEINSAFERLTGLHREAVLGRTVREVMPGIEPLWIERYSRVATTGEPDHFEGYNAATNRHFEVRAFSPARGQFAVLFEDVTERVVTERALRESERRVRDELAAILEPTGQYTPLELTDIIDRDAVQALVTDICGLTGIAVALLDQRGEVLVASGWQDICTRYHRVHPQTGAACLESDTLLSGGIDEGAYRLYRCRNGMWDMATPIVIGGSHVGNLYIGQFFFEDEEVDRDAFRRQAQRCGFDEAAYLAALDRVPRISRQTATSVMALYTRLAGMLASLSHSNLRLARALAERDGLLGEVRRSEERYRVLVEHAGEAIFVAQDGILKYLNSKTSQIIGHPPERLLGAGVADFIHPDDRGLVMSRHRQRASGADLPTTYTFRAINASDETLWAELNVVPIDWEGRPATLNFLSDVTERKQAEEALIAGQQRYRKLTDTIPLGIEEIDLQGRIEYVSPAYLKMMRCSNEQAVGTYMWDSFVDGAGLRAYLQRLVRELPAPQPWYGQARTLEGATIDVRVDWDYRRSTRGELEGFIAVLADVTGQRQLEAQLLQAQKMESVGRLAGGVAHDFNNLLTAISGYAEFVLDELAVDARARVDIQEVLRNAERASNLTRQLLAFSRKQTMAMRPVDLNTLILDLGKLLRRLIGEHIDLVLQPADSLPIVLADPAQLEQVIVNLAVNARDAMQRGGRLTMTTMTTALPPAIASSRPDLPLGQYALLSVSDTGMGMDAAVLERIFEPFFTTKEPDRGTGLGLATAYGVVTQHGGHITAESQPGAGSTFRIYLPAHSAATTAASAEADANTRRGGGETILLVEDEPQVRAVERRALQRLGYVVVEAGNGEEALGMVAGMQVLPDLIITDMVMPKMGGAELATRLRQVHPAILFLFTSGYTDNPQALSEAMGSGRYLHKPFSAQTLAAAVRQALDTTPDGG